MEVVNAGDAPLSVAVPIYGRRHELGVRPLRRCLLAARRATCAPGVETTIEFELGLDELGSWESGRPVAVPVEVGVWSSDEPDEPGHAVRLRVTDEEGTSWRRWPL